MSVGMLNQIIHDEVNLYGLLELDTRGFSPDDIPIMQIKKQFRSLALKYHPDKNVDIEDNDNNVTRFHLITTALQILTNPTLKQDYDSWFKRKFLISIDTERQGYIDKLKRSETNYKTKAQQQTQNDSVVDIKKYGETLRKLKHFKKSYGNWKGLNLGSSTDASHNNNKLYDSSTLRIEITSEDANADMRPLLEKAQLQTFFTQTTMVNISQIDDIYYSNRNTSNSRPIVAYIVFKTPYESLNYLNSWKSNRSSNSIYTIGAVSPRIPTHYYKDIRLDRPIGFTKELDELINDNSITID